MSLQDIYKKAGVVMKPAAMKDGKLYSQQPHSGAGDFNFSRADGVQTRINKHGLIETVANNEPRLSYDIVDGKVSDCPHLLLEPSRTNNFQRSEEFNNSYWTKTNSTVTANQIVSPDGSQNADTLTQSSAGGYLRKDVSFSGSETASFFVKANSVNFVSLFSGGNEVYFDLINGSASSSSGSTLVSYKIDSYGSGWYRCSITTSYSGSSSVRLYPSQSDGLKGTTIGSVYVYGAQLEAGSYATSYIPTSGSTETRQAEFCNGSGNSETFNDSEGVLFAEIEALADDLTFRVITLSDSSTSDFIKIGYRNTSNVIYYTIDSGGSNQSFQTYTAADIKLSNKIAVKYKGGDISLFFNGFEVLTDTTSTTMPFGLNQLSFDDGVGGSDLYGKTKQLATFKKALTDAELEKLTSWESFFDMAKGQEYNVKL